MNLLTYKLGANVCAFSTTREGGVSQGAYSTFSICDYCGDETTHVHSNRATLCKHLNIKDNQLILPHQSHTTNVAIVRESDIANGTRFTDTDALITNVKNCCIGISTADCVPLLLYDPHAECIAAIHAGWRGTVNRIAEKTIRSMQEVYGSLPNHILAIIGPSISEPAFEVGDEVYETFQAAHFNMEEIAHRYPALNGQTKWHIDLWKANAHQLLNMGIPAAQIQNPGICTYTAHNNFFSARRLGIRSGRIYTGILMKELTT